MGLVESCVGLSPTRREIMSGNEKISRRSWIKGAALFSTMGGIAPLLSSTTPAEAKVAKSMVHYQDHPKQMQMCGMCKYFISGSSHGDRGHGMMGSSGMMMGMMGSDMMESGMTGTGRCKLVAGQISHMGYCDLYAARSR